MPMIPETVPELVRAADALAEELAARDLGALAREAMAVALGVRLHTQHRRRLGWRVVCETCDGGEWLSHSPRCPHCGGPALADEELLVGADDSRGAP